MNFFHNHPNSVNQTYTEHMLNSLDYGCRALAGAGALFIHAFLPDLLTDWGGDTIIELSHDISEKRALQNQPIIDLEPIEESSEMSIDDALNPLDKTSKDY